MSDRTSDEPTPEVTRRVVLRGAALSGVALPLLAACGNDSTSGDSPGTSAGGDGSSAPESSSGGGGGGLATTSDVPVGGGDILTDQQIVLTQPVKGDFKAFTAVCTHMQCVVNEISDGVIHCPCHGSQYSIKDGSVITGPAPRPLAPIQIDVKGNEITRA